MWNKQTKNEFVSIVLDQLGTTFKAKEVKSFAAAKGYDVPNFIFGESFTEKVSHGVYRLLDGGTPVKKKHVKKVPELEAAPAMVAQVVQMHTKRALNVTESFVPEANPWYVPFGFYNDLKKIIKSNQFCPVYITGLSGNGKTMMVEQICANLKREFVRVNITKRTDESDLIGTYELIDGNTIRREGPVITAMRRGAVLLLDEVDYGTEEILCLNGVLEGKPFFDKKTGEIIHAAKGFTVVATANTKGKGSDDGRFIGANVLNEAFLERFAFTWEQEYPEQKVELEIVNKAFESFGINQPEFANKLVAWATVIRKAFNDDAVDEVISTRRLVHIVNAYNIFGSRKKAIEMCLNRYDSEVKTSFLDLYTKIDAEAEAVVQNSETPAE